MHLSRIFFLGNLAGEWMSGWQRCETLRQLGHEVIPFCQSAFVKKAAPSRWKRLANCCSFDDATVTVFNEQWLLALCECRPDIAWLEWPKMLRRETLLEARSRLPRCRFISFYDDNPFGSRTDELWQWKMFFEAIPEFDLHLVKRNEDIAALRLRGARRAELFMHGCYEPLFHPRRGSASLVHQVSFVGTALDHRVSFIRRLIVREQLPLEVFGNRWARTLLYHLRREHFHPPALGLAYVDVIRDSRISLGFVSSSNRDEYTMRTFEIPACMGFMLAERTPTHQALFEEGVEAEFFATVEECADKARFYLRDEVARRRIAKAGYQRCLDSNYSLRRRMSNALSHVKATPQIVVAIRLRGIAAVLDRATR
jgi:hypothetical protein